MKEVLSQKDIDHLLSQMQKKQAEPVAELEAEERTIFKYNFKSQKKINKEQFLLLENLHKRFLRNIEASLTNLLNIPVIANLSAATELSYHEFSESLSSPSCLYLLKVTPGYGKFLLEVDLKFAFYVIDRVLGGGMSHESSISRELSQIEERIMNRVIRLILQDLEEAWHLVDSLSFSIEGFYSQPDYMQVIGAEDKVFLVSVDIRSERDIGLLNLCMPIDFLEFFVSRHRARQTHVALNRTEAEQKQDQAVIKSHLRKFKVPVRAILGRAQFVIQDLMDLRPGDVICLQTRKDKPSDLLVGNCCLFKGHAFKDNRLKSIRISEMVKERN